MTAVFLAAFIIGLIVAVRAMLFGVEKPSPETAVVFSEEPPPVTGDAHVRYTLPVVSGFLVLFGLVGYLLRRWSTLGDVAVVAIAVGAGLLAAWLSRRGVRRAVAMVPEHHDVDDPRYVLQGHVARVTEPIAGDRAGEIVYEIGTTRHVVAARGLGGSHAESGSDVVIERIEDGMAYVEPWAEVEKRL
jgi:membrane protein implicated in regulation of membrane protease activity